MQDSSTEAFSEGQDLAPDRMVKDNSISQRHLDNMQKRRDEARAALMAIPGIEKEIVWEIGCGHGHFLTGFNQANPERVCVGVDIILDRVERGLRKRDRAELDTLHFVRTEATMFLDVLPETTLFSAIFILFPDPWPKKRHHKNRLLQAPFMARLATRCKPGTPFHFRTDFAPYFAEVVEMLKAHPDWQLRDDLPWPYELETVFQKRAEGSYQSLIATRR
jgi:tRNA (guanine-N7-)-methyltransferase